MAMVGLACGVVVRVPHRGMETCMTNRTVWLDAATLAMVRETLQDVREASDPFVELALQAAMLRESALVAALRDIFQWDQQMHNCEVGYILRRSMVMSDGRGDVPPPSRITGAGRLHDAMSAIAHDARAQGDVTAPAGGDAT